MSGQSLVRERYISAAVPKLVQNFGLKNPMEVPRLDKVVVNMGLGKAVENPKLIEAACDQLTKLAGQRAVVTKARKSIASFKLRENMPIGCMVTLRRDRMWEFLDRLVNVALPQVRDFKGVSRKGFDPCGNFTMGLKEQYIFPEIDYDKVEAVHGMNVTLVFRNGSKEKSVALLEALGMPFRR